VRSVHKLVQDIAIVAVLSLVRMVMNHLLDRKFTVLEAMDISSLYEYRSDHKSRHQEQAKQPAMASNMLAKLRYH